MSDQSSLVSETGIGGMNFSNLMSLATLDTSDLKAQLSRLPAQGIYIVDLTKIGFSEQPPQDPADPMSYNLNSVGTILGFFPLKDSKKTDDAPVDPSELEGKNLNERYFLYGPQIKEAIQLLMGRFKVAGLRHKGLMGGVEGQAPGWIDEAVGKRIAIRVTHYTPKDGQERAIFTWLSPKQLSKANIGFDWAVMQRPFCDENGQEMDPDDLYGKKKAA